MKNDRGSEKIDYHAVPGFSIPLSADFIAAFVLALSGTAKVFVIGATGFLAIQRGWIKPEGLVTLGQLVALVTMPCQIFSRFSQNFDPDTFPGWWKIALFGIGITGFGLLLGRVLARRHNNNEAALLVGYQNSGFFVLPMLQALLPPQEFARASVYLFVFVIPFNASLWPVANRLLFQRSAVNWRGVLSPPTLTVLACLFLYGFFHDQAHVWDGTITHQILIGDTTPGALTLIGDLTVPLATIVLGGSIAATMATARAAGARITSRRATVETSLTKVLVYPALGYVLLHYWPGGLWSNDPVLWLFLMLQFAAPPAVNIAVFCQQNGFPMRLIPTASLLSYCLSLLTVPLWVATVPNLQTKTQGAQRAVNAENTSVSAPVRPLSPHPAPKPALATWPPEAASSPLSSAEARLTTGKGATGPAEKSPHRP